MEIDEIRIGLRVRVKTRQKNFGAPKYPGRVGTVVRQNPFGGPADGGLWYVRLDSTPRARERIEFFAGCDLEPE